MKHAWHLLGLTSLLVSGSLTLHPSAAHAATTTFTVDGSGDGSDLVIDGVCATALNSCTLRAALEEAGRAAQSSRKPTAELQFHICGLTTQILQTMAPGISQCILSCDTPIDAYHTMAFWLQARSYKREPQYDADRAAMVQKVYEQDFAVVSATRPAFVPDRELDELTVAADAMPMRLRAKIAQLKQRGWWIESGAAALPNVVRVLPSAARAADPEGWVLASEPCISP